VRSKVKQYSSLNKSHRSYGRHLEYGISQCYLASDTSECTPPNPSQAGTRCIYCRGMEGWVDLDDWSHTEMVLLAHRRSPIEVLTQQCMVGSWTHSLLITSVTHWTLLLSTNQPSWQYHKGDVIVKHCHWRVKMLDVIPPSWISVFFDVSEFRFAKNNFVSVRFDSRHKSIPVYLSDSIGQLGLHFPTLTIMLQQRHYSIGDW